MTISISDSHKVLTMIHVYDTTPETQAQVFDGLVEGLQTYGKRMAGHVSSSIHRSLDGSKVTSYSQWDPVASKALFGRERAASLRRTSRAAR